MLDITSSCRTCMKENVNLIDLYEVVKIEENCHQWADILVICTPTQVISLIITNHTITCSWESYVSQNIVPKQIFY